MKRTHYKILLPPAAFMSWPANPGLFVNGTTAPFSHTSGLSPHALKSLERKKIL